MKRVAFVAAAMAATLGLSMAGAVSAGRGDLPHVPEIEAYSVLVYYWVDDSNGNSLPIPDGLVGEFYAADGTDLTGWCTTTPTTTESISLAMNCEVVGLDVGEDYVIGVGGLPEGFFVRDVSCEPNLGEMLSDFEDAAITVDSNYFCNVGIYEMPTLWVDKTFSQGHDGGVASDFTIEVYTTGGELVGTMVDPSNDVCSDTGPDPATCGMLQLPPGNYVMGEQPVPGYLGALMSCTMADIERDMFPTDIGGFQHGADLTDTLCMVRNSYYESVVSADVVVVNDSGGDATGAEFTIEVYDVDGVLVGSAVDPEPGTGNASANWTLPIGEYTFGVSAAAGYEGYEASVVVTYVEVPVEMIDDESAAFVLEPFQNADAVITFDDPTTTTTTTTTTTLAPTTTIAATTTSIQGILPATGDQSGMVALVAFGLVLLGAGAVFATRRT